MHSRRPLCSAMFALLIITVACGGGPGVVLGSGNPDVTVTISPAAATIPEGGKVTLQATLKGLCSECISFITFWSVVENDNNVCLWGGVNMPPIGPCPGGTILLNPPAGNTLIVTYYAPSTPGTFHVTAEYSIVGVDSHGTSVITVSP
ncbi:MAG: hypothetical protein WB711_16845 [Terriglobales bacterium]